MNENSDQALLESFRKGDLAAFDALIPNMLLNWGNPHDRKGYLQRVREAAARYRADAVLLVNSATEVDEYVNPLSLLNLSIVGMWLVPGHNRDALTIVEGVVIDNRNGFLYYGTEAEGQGSIVRPLMMAQEKKAVDQSRIEAYRAFGDELVRGAKRLRNAPLEPRGRRYATPRDGR